MDKELISTRLILPAGFTIRLWCANGEHLEVGQLFVELLSSKLWIGNDFGQVQAEDPQRARGGGEGRPRAAADDQVQSLQFLTPFVDGHDLGRGDVLARQSPNFEDLGPRVDAMIDGERDILL